MFTTTKDKEKEVIKINENIKNDHKLEREYKNSRQYKIKTKLSKLIKYGPIKLINNRIKLHTDANKRDEVIVNSKYTTLRSAKNDRTDTNYFSNDKIAVYTCITGNYDNLIEPLCKPDNIDYFVITDSEVASNSLWKKININNFKEITNYSNALKNRYFKMNPHKIFNDYKYSIYVDGNFKIYSDLTEHVNRLSKYGFSCFKHSSRVSCFEEADACKLLRKASVDEIDSYVQKLHNVNFPDDYGLLYCGFLVRENKNIDCINIMNQWWDEFKNNVKRDQLLLPYILFNNGIQVKDIATLGNNAEEDLSFEIVEFHNKKH